MSDHQNESFFDDDEENPTPAASASTRQSRAARRKVARQRLIIGLAAGVVVLASIGIGAAYAASRPMPADQRYVTVAATAGDLTQTLSFTGTVDKSNQASTSFPSDGTVTKVYVGLGDQVVAGQKLASIKATDLQQAVDTAQANLDQAKLTLQQLTSSSSSTSSNRGNGKTNSGQSSPSSGSTPSGGATPSGGSTENPSQIAGALAAAQDAAQQANLAMATACAPLLGGAPTPSTPSETPTETETEPPTEPPSEPVTLTPEQVQDCTAAMTALANANQAVSQLATTLAQVTDQLNTALSSAQQQCQASIQAAIQQASGQMAQALAQQQLGGGSGSQTQKLAAQIAVDQAQDALTQAQIDLSNATITAPIDGVVASMPYQVGQLESTSDELDIVGVGGVSVQLSVTVSQIAKITVGQSVVITEPGVGQANGSVSVKTLAPAAAGGSTYSVTVAASGGDAADLLGGVTGQVVITVGQVKNAVLVPISAVLIGETGTSGTVEVLANGAVSTVVVTIAGVGATQVAISQGVNVGDLLVLADTQEALPTSLDGIARALGGGGGGQVVGGGQNRPTAYRTR